MCINRPRYINSKIVQNEGEVYVINFSSKYCTATLWSWQCWSICWFDIHWRSLVDRRHWRITILLVIFHLVHDKRLSGSPLPLTVSPAIHYWAL